MIYMKLIQGENYGFTSVIGGYMSTLFLYLHLLFIMLSIVNVICFMKLINKISSKQNKSKTEEYHKYHVHALEKPKPEYIIVHRKESKGEYNKDNTEIMKEKISSIESEISDIKEQLDGKDSKSVVYDCTKVQ